MDIVISVVAKVAELLVVPIRRQIGYVVDWNTNIQNLKNEVEKLTDAKTRVIHYIEEARRNGEEIEVDVENWLRSVDGVIEGGVVVVGDESSKKCFMGLCPDLKIRYRLGKAAKEELTVVVDLQDKGKFDRVSYRAAPLGTIGPVKDYEAFESRNSVLNAIVDALKDGGVNMVGVYGMPGVGKTTLVKKAAEQVKEGRLFDKVVLAVVSQTPDIRRIQGDIADGLGLRLDAETDRGRASQLCGGLKKVAKVLVILDDIWKELKLEDVGIPLGSDHEGCKILMSSRNEDVLSRGMGANKYFKLEVLPESEAWDFFEKMVGVTVKNPSVQLVAAEVAKRCAGLPILLATVARALKNKEEYAWKDALKQLTRFDKDEIADPVYSCLELSYKALRGDEIKSLFLLCGQFLTYDSSISDLLKYAIGLDLFKGRSKLEEARNRLRTLVDELKASCLLLEGDRDGRVKMHDDVQSFVSSFASREHHVLVVPDELKEWPTNDVLQQCIGISSPYRKIPDLPAILECPNLRSFILLNKDPSLQIPDNFFREMKELKVLDLTEVNLSPLPSSLQFLENLQTLCLDHCVLEDISIVGELKKLKVLSLISSNIVRLPREIGKLTRLLLLDLSNCERLEVISPNALSSLTRLEDLYMGNSFVKWETEGSSSQRNNACLSELKRLSNLSTLDMQITDADNMPKDLFSSFQNLERFRIFIGDGWDWSVKDATSRTLKLKLNTVIQLEEGVNTLLKITEELHLQELNGVKSILNDLDGEGFRQLRHLHVQNCPGVQYIINSIRMGPRTAFLNLDSLLLENLDNLEKICHGQLMAESLGNLRVLKVESCHRLKNLFSVSMARRLVRIEEITIIDCKIMEEVVAEESESDAADGEPIEFTQLRRLTLQCLPQFTSFHSNVEESSDSQRRQKLLASEARSKEIVAGNELGTSMSLFNTKILFPNLEDLKLSSIKVEKIWHDQPAVQSPFVKNLASIAVENCSNLNYLLTSSMVESLSQLKRLEICNCKSMEEIVVPEGIGEGKMLFPKLLFLELTDLPKLTRFCTSNLLECPSLKVLTLGKCPELKEFISIPLSADIPAMSKPDNTKSALFDDKVAFPKLEVFLSFEMDNLKVIWHNELHSHSFCKLKILHVGHGKNLLNIFPSSMLGRFHNLENLIINDCDSVEEIFDLQELINVEQRLAVTATQLRVVRLWNLPHLKHVWNRDPQGILSFDNLCTVHVRGCPGLRSLFPASIALNLLQLNGVKSIFNDLDGEGFPQLKHLHVQNCPGIQYVINSIRMGPHTAFLNLDSLLLDNLDNLEKICHGQLMAESLGNLRILKVESCHRLKNLFSVSMARRLVRIEEITIIDCKIMEEVVAEDSENDAADGEPIEFTQLRRLTLQCLPQFTSFHSNVEESSASQRRQKLLLAGDVRSKEIVAGNELGTSMSLFNTKILFPNLEDLKLSSIKVEKIWRDQPSVQAPCVKNLASIAVENCSNLNYLLTSSMVESLAQLERLEICNCKSMEEIVVPEDIGEGKMMSKMLFPKLLILSLIRLPKLTRFCTSNLLECHSLKVLTVGNCPELKEFISIPSSADVRAMSKPDNTKSALFDDKVAFPDLEEFLIAEMDNLKLIWHSELHSDSFCKLKTLHVVLVKNLLNIFPSSMLRRFHNLENLTIGACDSVEEIFDLQELINVEQRLAVTASQLRVVRLTNLPHLKHVWNRDPQGILSFDSLCTVHVRGCPGLRSLFPASIALKLLQLEELLIENCGVEEIVAKDEGLEEGPSSFRFLFPKVTYLHLVEVPELKRFYPGIHTSEWPRLKKFWVYHCKKIEIFPSEIKCSHEPCREDHMDIEGQQPLLSFRKIFPNLEDLYLESKDASALLKSLCPQDFYYKLKVLNLVCFHGAHATFPIDLLPRFPKLEKLIAGCSEFKELLPSRLDVMEKHGRVLSSIRHLELDSLPCLEHLWKSNSQLDQALQTLETLVVQNCGSLIYLAPSHASFQNLTNLDVWNCKRLVKLVTSTTAKSLAQLTRMKVAGCSMVAEIVANEEEGIKDEIIFSKLEILELHRLPSLTSFCSEKHSFDFPSLVEVTVSQCPEMKFFSNGALSTPKLRRVKLTEEDKKGSWVGNLNTTIQQLSTQTKAQIAGSSSS